jgi:hypothetical protein
MIDNILADHLLLSDSRLERWLLRCSQKGGDDGAGGNSGSLVTKVQMEKKNLAAPIQLLKFHVTYPQCDKQRASGSNILPRTPSPTPSLHHYDCFSAVCRPRSITTAVLLSCPPAVDISNRTALTSARTESNRTATLHRPRSLHQPRPRQVASPTTQHLEYSQRPKAKEQTMAIAGKPHLNYFHPKIVNDTAVVCGRQVHDTILKEIKSALGTYDMKSSHLRRYRN